MALWFKVEQQSNILPEELLSNPEMYSCPGRLVSLIGSYYEGFPNALLEAGLHGVPAVAYDVPGIPEIMTAQSGILAEDGKLNSARAAIRKAVAAKLGPMLHRYQTRFDYETFNEQILQPIFKMCRIQVLSGHKPGCCSNRASDHRCYESKPGTWRSWWWRYLCRPTHRFGTSQTLHHRSVCTWTSAPWMGAICNGVQWRNVQFIEVKSELWLWDTFVSHSDTEVIIKAYHEWGQACIHRFRGCLHLPFGIKYCKSW